MKEFLVPFLEVTRFFLMPYCLEVRCLWQTAQKDGKWGLLMCQEEKDKGV